MSSANPSVYSGSIAIIGGGITGLTLTIGLLKRGFNVTVYEQSRKFGEIGAGVAFHPAAERAMKVCHDVVHEGYLRVVTHNVSEAKRQVYSEFVDGRKKSGDGASATESAKAGINEDPVLFTLKNASGANGLHRAHFLAELIKHIPESITHFRKRLETIEPPTVEGGKYTIKFADGTTAEHDVIIGTDGIKSSVRAWLVGGEKHPSAHPVYTHMYAYRGLIPMSRAVEHLGADAAGTFKMYLGDNAHVLTYPVDHGDAMNVVATCSDPNDWPDYRHLTRHSTKEQVYADFSSFSPTVTKIIDLLEPDLDCWAMFDIGSHPLQRYNRGRVLVLGDAGHATTPHHGSGAGMCIEDAALLAELLTDDYVTKAGNRGIEDAFEAFTAERLSRTQRLVQSSRRAGELYQARTELGDDFAAVARELEWRYRFFWEGDIQQFIRDAKAHLADMRQFPVSSRM